MNRFRGGLVFKAHGLLYHSTLCLRVIKKKKKHSDTTSPQRGDASALLIAWVCTTRRRVPASEISYQGLAKGDLRAGGRVQGVRVGDRLLVASADFHSSHPLGGVPQEQR